MSVLLDEAAMGEAVASLAGEIRAVAEHGRVAIVGIRSRGDEVAERVSAILKEAGIEHDYGMLDISLYRDDLSHLAENPKLQSSEISFQVDGSHIVLVDDVLFTGRTIRAALDALTDYGRPARIQLAVLIDRGHREIPIQPDYSGVKLETARMDHVIVRLKKTDGEDAVELVTTP
ncbi:MAG: bifunctional pyr operon transcriptional regulator/uracil phosphoribosyltransferase [Roseibacillus sp.]|jgi:pyrimidine operon attenuation protein/uracil phosphoribosyltransferase|nr:bifunctional pyr operon transcriptional regulator/uracil phosphoribosyltransferase [Roseibacillus sp.]